MKIKKFKPAMKEDNILIIGKEQICSTIKSLVDRDLSRKLFFVTPHTHFYKNNYPNAEIVNSIDLVKMCCDRSIKKTIVFHDAFTNNMRPPRAFYDFGFSSLNCGYNIIMTLPHIFNINHSVTSCFDHFLIQDDHGFTSTKLKIYNEFFNIFPNFSSFDTAFTKITENNRFIVKSTKKNIPKTISDTVTYYEA